MIERECRKCGTTIGPIVSKKECSHFYFDLCVPCDQKYFAFLTEQTQKWLELSNQSNNNIERKMHEVIDNFIDDGFKEMEEKFKKENEE